MIRVLSSAGLFGVAVFLQPHVASDPVVHVLLQFSALILAGGLVGTSIRLPLLMVGPSLVLGIVIGAIWMLPRSLDAALLETGWMAAKFLTLPLCVGAPIAAAWKHIGPILKGFLKAQSISMMLFLSFLYTHAPVRLCNSYLEEDQVRLGVGFAYLALGLILIWVAPLFIGDRKPYKERLAL